MGYSLARYLDTKVKRHGEHRHHNICHRQRDDEVVRYHPAAGNGEREKWNFHKNNRDDYRTDYDMKL